MAKSKIIYSCSECGAQHSKWQGQCRTCGAWNSLEEEIEAPKTSRSTPGNASTLSTKPLLLDEVDLAETDRILLKDPELNRVLGGGIVPGAIMLLGGEPGIGKSTLLLQLALQLAGKKVLYVSGEESAGQLKMRASRIKAQNKNLFVFAETQLERILQQVDTLQPEILIIDSVQTLQSTLTDTAAGSVSQIKYCTQELIRVAKGQQLPVFLVGHITKEGSIAGPKILEHMVDVVLSFEGDRQYAYRIIRSQKNRFGSTLELGIYEMEASGLRAVENPSELFLSSNTPHLSGVAISATLEGIRPLLIETQALVATTAYGTPQRSSTGFDLRRLNMLLAVLEKRCGLKLATKDVFINLSGGVKIQDPALDLGVAAAIVSSYYDIAISSEMAFAAEVALTGELRPVSRIGQRLAEAEKLGFKQILLADSQAQKNRHISKKINLIGVSDIKTALGIMLKQPSHQ